MEYQKKVINSNEFWLTNVEKYVTRKCRKIGVSRKVFFKISKLS